MMNSLQKRSISLLRSKSLRPTISIFCGASSGNSPVYVKTARALAFALHKNNIKLVYGGGTSGLMGEIARTLVRLSGPTSVHGIIPAPLRQYKQRMDKEDIPNEEIYGRTTVVKDMHSRKRLMAEAVVSGGPGSGFIALPGGYGTFEELMEVVTWNQLGIHNRGIVVLNVEGYWDCLMDWVVKAIDAGFVNERNQKMISEATDVEAAVDSLKNYQACEGRFDLKWTDGEV
ncbi:hypothetical protein BKA61DRAFT_637673 [Leptodontidium sp. MPI-SDFR-AT-0119]|nr:hypothetical protein BKA61DRAFT_637673 [Leptodontidium sp. MPI-SDFR-AT-0119]